MRLATRASALALAQAGGVAEALGGAELVEVRGEGPEGDKARYVSGVEGELLAGRAELGVHSAKDLPGELADGLAIVAVPRREDPADCFVGPAGSLAELAPGARIGTSSLRRRAQLLALRPDIEVVELHGNVDTRLGKLAAGECEGLVLALAGLRRLDRGAEAAFAFGPSELIPAPGQGNLALQARSGDEGAMAAAGAITDSESAAELAAERALCAELGTSCDTPVGACARHERRVGEARLVMRAFAGLPDGSEWVRDVLEGDPAEPEALGREVAVRLRAAGASEILGRLR